MLLLSLPSTILTSVLIDTTNPLIDPLLCTSNLRELGLMKNHLMKIYLSPDANLDINIMEETTVKNHTCGTKGIMCEKLR